MLDTWLIVGLSVGTPLVTLVLIVAILFLFRWFCVGFTGSRSGTETTTKLLDKVVVITGASSGLGAIVARKLYLRGAKVFLLCRNRHDAEFNISRMLELGTSAPCKGSVDVVHLDLASLDSVRACAGQLMTKTNKIDILINNAGMFTDDPKAKTLDGFNMNFGINYLSHFLLTEMLMPLLMAAKDDILIDGPRHFKPKIINVSCSSHGKYKLEIDKMLSTTDTDLIPWRSYCNSKLANILHANELHNRYFKQVNTYSLNPGSMPTKLRKSLSWLYRSVDLFGFFCLKHKYYAAETVLYCALHPDTNTQSGLYYEDCKVKSPHSSAKDCLVQTRLYEMSRRAVGLEE